MATKIQKRTERTTEERKKEEKPAENSIYASLDHKLGEFSVKLNYRTELECETISWIST